MRTFIIGFVLGITTLAALAQKLPAPSPPTIEGVLLPDAEILCHDREANAKLDRLLERR